MAHSAPRKIERRQRIILISLILCSAIAVTIWEPISLPQLLEWGRWFVTNPWAIAGLIVIQALLFTFAMPGTMVIWLIAPFHPPAFAVSIMLAGSLAGALGAYRLSGRLGENWQPKRGAWLFRLLSQRSDFFTQTALRVLPGCPHWAVNYGAGILRVPLWSFLAAALLGLTIKWSLYCWVIYGTTNAAQADDRIGVASLWPLLVLALIMIAGSFIRQRIQARSLQQADDSSATPFSDKPD